MRVAGHPWEEKGFGVAPFRFDRIEKANERSPGRCSHCGRSILWMYWVVGSTGDAFTVGSECIKRAEPLFSPLREQANEARNQATEAEKARRIESAKRSLSEDASLLANRMLPYGGNRTLRQWAEFAMENGGSRKQLEVAGVVERAVADRQT